MRKLIFILSFLFAFVYSNAQVSLGGYIQTFNNSSYPTHLDSLGKGGYMVVSDTIGRNNISCLRRKYGMAVYVQNNQKLYILKDNTCVNNWEEFSSGIDSTTASNGLTNFNKMAVPLNEPDRPYTDIATAPNKDVYVSVAGTGRDIYKQTSGVGSFVPLGAPSVDWVGITVAPNGDVYATGIYLFSNTGDIYKQTGGVGSFVPLGAPVTQWKDIAAAPNGDIYAISIAGLTPTIGLYKQTGGVGSFNLINTFFDYNNPGQAITISPNGNIYIATTTDIYLSTNSGVSFSSLNQFRFENSIWSALSSSPNGDVYAAQYNGNVYKQTGGIGNFKEYGQNTLNWVGLASNENNVYIISSNPGFIYKFKDSNNIQLGGDLTRNTIINANNKVFIIDSASYININKSDGNTILNGQLYSSYLQTKIYDSIRTGNYQNINYIEDVGYFTSNKIESLSSRELGDSYSAIEIKDTSISLLPNKGSFYIDSLSTNIDTVSNYPLKWNPTTGKVEAYSGGFASNVLANNGLSKVGDTIQLGGSLTKDTYIHGRKNSFAVDSLYYGGLTSRSDSGSFATIYTVAGELVDRGESGIVRLQANRVFATGNYSILDVESDSIRMFTQDSIIHIPTVKINSDTANYLPLMWNPNVKRLEAYTGGFAPSIDTNSLRRVKYVGLTMPPAFTITPGSSPITDSGTIVVTGAGTASQYVRGDGVLASFPTATTGGGASVSYYLNGSVNKGTFGGQTYYEMSRTAIIGAGTDFTRTNTQGDGLVAQFITDTITNLLIPAGNWNLELYFSASSGGGTPSFYVELYKYDGANFTLISSNSTSPELIAFGTTINPYFCALAVPETILSGTDRLAIRVFVNTSGRSITLHTENSHLCQIITTFTTGLTALNGLTKQVQYFDEGTSGTDFNISSSNDTHTFNLPTASATNRGALSSTDWSTFNGKLGSSDTISLSNRINTKLNISDTATMLSPYARTNSVNASLATKLNISDSAAMLLPYLRKIDTASLSNRIIAATGWGIIGNSGTSDATNFIGTTDNQDVVFRRNNVISGRIDSTSQGGGNGGITAFGFGSNPTAPNATAFGFKALARNTSSPNATGNVAVGNLAGTNITSGERNTIIGHNSLTNGTTAGFCTTLGYATLGKSIAGELNTAIGAHALGDNLNASQNTALGDFAGGTTTTGGNNTFLGSRAGRYNTTASNQIFINSIDRSNYTNDQTQSPFYAQQNSTVANQIVTLNGRVGINTISPNTSSTLDITSTTRGFLQPRMNNSEMNAISTPATGLSVFNTTDSLEYVYRGTSSGWQKNVTYTRTNDIGLLNGADQRVMIEPTTNLVAGRALTVEAGSTQAGGASAFTALSQTTRAWRQMASTSGGDIYIVTLGADIYERTGGTGNFITQNAGNRQWIGIAVAPNGDVYASVFNGDIYKQTGGTGAFNALSQTTRGWTGMAAAPNGDIYAATQNGDIYKQTAGTGNFIALSQTSRLWAGMTAAPNGDIYASVSSGDIYKQTGGVGNFTALNQTLRDWAGMATASNGDVYAVVNNGDIYKQTGGVGNFTALNQTTRAWTGITVAPNGDIYASVNNGDIYLQSQGTANLNGGTLVLQSGVGKGTGTSTINFNTGTTLASGATLQTASTKMTILGNGNVGIGTTSPSAKLELSDTARGFLQTRMTTTQRNNIASPATGLQVFTTTDSSQYVYRGTGAGWQQIANEIVNTASLNFPSTNAQNSSDLTITLTGAVDGDAVVLGVPNAAVNANSCYTAWVSAANTVTVRFNNYSSGAIDPAQATFRVTIIK